MRKSRFTEEQIIGLLREVEAGRKVSDVCREQGVSEATFYRWRSKYSGLEVGDAKRLRQLEDENERPSSREGCAVERQAASFCDPRGRRRIGLVATAHERARNERDQAGAQQQARDDEDRLPERSVHQGFPSDGVISVGVP